MYEASDNDMENYETFCEIIQDTEMSAVDVLNALTNWHGMQLMSREFIQNYLDCEM